MSRHSRASPAVRYVLNFHTGWVDYLIVAAEERNLVYKVLEELHHYCAMACERSVMKVLLIISGTGLSIPFATMYLPHMTPAIDAVHRKA